MSAEQFRSLLQIERDLARAFGVTNAERWRPGLGRRLETLVLQAYRLGQRDGRQPAKEGR